MERQLFERSEGALGFCAALLGEPLDLRAIGRYDAKLTGDKEPVGEDEQQYGREA